MGPASALAGLDGDERKCARSMVHRLRLCAAVAALTACNLDFEIIDPTGGGGAADGAAGPGGGGAAEGGGGMATASNAGGGGAGGRELEPLFDCDFSGAVVPEQIDSFEGGSCVRLSDGEVRCWGYDSWGQLGRGYYHLAGDPAPVVLNLPGPAHFIDLELAGCAIIGDCVQPELYCWGRNQEMQVGVAPTSDVRPPTKVELPGRPFDVVTGDIHTCALVDDEGTSRLFCWGQGYSGQVGVLTNTPILPTEVDLQGDVPLDVFAAHNTTCVLVERDGNPGGARCFGANAYGLLGNAGPETPLPTVNPNVAPTAPFEFGGDNGCTWVGNLSSCWGGNYYGQLTGASDGDPHPVAVDASFDEDIAYVLTGRSGLFAVLESGRIFGRGGQTMKPVAAPNTPQPLLNFTELEELEGLDPVSIAGNNCGYSAKDDEIYCWGDHYNGKGSMGPNFDASNSLHSVPFRDE